MKYMIIQTYKIIINYLLAYMIKKKQLIFYLAKQVVKY